MLYRPLYTCLYSLAPDKHFHQPAELVHRNLDISSRISNQHHAKAYFRPNHNCLSRSMPRSILWWLPWSPMPLLLWYTSLNHTPALNIIIRHPSLMVQVPPRSIHLPLPELPCQIRDTSCAISGWKVVFLFLQITNIFFIKNI